jgi:hypothetical protein
MKDCALILEKADLSNKGGTITLPIVRVVETEDLLFIRDFTVTKPLSEEAFQKMQEPMIPEREKISKDEYEELSVLIQQPAADIQALRKAKKLKAFLFIDQAGTRMLLLPKGVISATVVSGYTPSSTQPSASN